MYVAFDTLREANVARQAEWDTGGDITLAYAGNELAGEVGEAIEVTGMFDHDALEDEIGDVVICCDLIAMRIGQELSIDALVDERWRNASQNDAIADLAVATGQACNSIKKLERERFGMAGSRSTPDDLRNHLEAIVLAVHKLAMCSGISSVGYAVANKFNRTSAKVGLKTRLLPPNRMN